MCDDSDLQTPVPCASLIRSLFGRQEDTGYGLSPMTSLMLDFEDAALSTPPCRPPVTPESQESAIEIEDESTDGSNRSRNGLMTNAFTLDSAEQSPATRRAEQRTRGVQRRLNIAPIRMTYDGEDECTTPEKQIIQSGEDLSFYDGSSPQQTPPPCVIEDACMESDLTPETSPARFTATSTTHTARRMPSIEDPNTCDSGFSNDSALPSSSASSTSSLFRFLQPSGLAPRKTPAKSPGNVKMFHSLSSNSMESGGDDEYMELFSMEDDDDDDDQQIPTDFNSLLSGDIKAVRNSPPEQKRPAARRSLSLSETSIAMRRARSNLFEKLPPTPERRAMQTISNTTPVTTKNTFKRPEPPTISPTQHKRLKFENTQENDEPELTSPQMKHVRPVFRKSISMHDTQSIMTALHRSNTEPNLIGDFSKPFCLPLTEGRHSDLKSISVDTMAGLLRGDFKDSVASFKVIDCRYPYEYEGGHIRGAVNLYMQDQILDALVNSKTEAATTECNNFWKRNILVFHCEFSSERGPKLSRFLRNNDRMRNTESYPALHYPEIYLLHGGYKDFFAAHADLCDPMAYRQMLDPEFTESYKQFRAKTRSWSGDPKASGVKGTLVKSRSRLVL